MSSISYAGVQMQIVATREISSRAVLSRDNTTYQTTRWVFDVDAVINPQAVSYKSNPAIGSLIPIKSAGTSAPVTHAAIRYLLSQPQEKLVYQVAGVTLLSVPNAPYLTDALVGPSVEVFNITDVLGDKTFLISLRIVAHVNETPALAGKVPILLSHRWRRWVQVSEDYFSEIVTEGEAQFRMDELLRRGTIPDQYRWQLFHPIPNNCQRSGITVVPSEDGAGCRYRFVDREVPFNIVHGTELGATRVQAHETRSVTDPSIFQNIIQSLPGIIGNTASGAMQRGLPGAVGGLLGGALNVALASQSGLFITCVARAWGYRKVPRRNLARLAIAVVLSRLGLPADSRGASIQAHMMHDLTGKYVEFQMSYAWKSIFGMIGSNRGNISFYQAMIGFGEEDVLNPFLSENDGPANAPPPNSVGTRGTLVCKLMAQALSNPGALPPRPGQANLAVNVDATL